MPPRPDAAAWPADDKALRELPDGTALTVDGRLQAALKSADYRALGGARPRSERYVQHVVVVDGGDVGPACNPAVELDYLRIDAHRARARCRHPACRALYARADAAQHPDHSK